MLQYDVPFGQLFAAHHCIHRSTVEVGVFLPSVTFVTDPFLKTVHDAVAVQEIALSLHLISDE